MKIESLNVDDIVKSNDFQAHDDCYIIGRVAEVDRYTAMFKLEPLCRVFGGKEVKDSTPHWVPLQGAFHGDTEGWKRVEVIGHGLWLGNMD